MVTRKHVFSLVMWSFSVLLIIFILNGCMGKKPVMPALDDLLTQDLNQIDDEKAKYLLNEAYTSELNKGKYWIPGMERLLKAKKLGVVSPGIPREHIKFLLKDCNQQKYREVYDQAVYLWFKDIFQRKVPYSVKDKNFLESYVRSCINYCGSGKCNCIRTCQKITNKIDPALYKAYFGNQGPFSN